MASGMVLSSNGMQAGYPAAVARNRAGSAGVLDGLRPQPLRYNPRAVGGTSDLEDRSADQPESLFSEAIREHLELKARNSQLEEDMPLDPYLDGDPLENHPLFKSEEQARIEETMDGEPAAELSSERLPWPGEETVENVEGAVLDEALWTGRPRDFDWGD